APRHRPSGSPRCPPAGPRRGHRRSFDRERRSPPPPPAPSLPLGRGSSPCRPTPLYPKHIPPGPISATIWAEGVYWRSTAPIRAWTTDTEGRNQMSKRLIRFLSLLTVLALVLAACGGDDGGGTTDTE